MTAVARAETRVALLKEAEAVAGRLRANETEYEKLLEERATTCRDLRNAGVPLKEVQEVLGLSRSRVQQILRGTRV